jgi:hypothetical protein
VLTPDTFLSVVARMEKDLDSRRLLAVLVPRQLGPPWAVGLHWYLHGGVWNHSQHGVEPHQLRQLVIRFWYVCGTRTLGKSFTNITRIPHLGAFVPQDWPPPCHARLTGFRESWRPAHSCPCG